MGIVGDTTSLQYLICGLARIPEPVRSDRPSAFTHAKLRFDEYQTLLATAIEDIYATPNLTPNDEKFDDVLRRDVSEESFDKALATVKSLMLYLLALLFINDRGLQAEAESHFDTLSEKAEHLEHKTHDRLLRGLGPWQAWLPFDGRPGCGWPGRRRCGSRRRGRCTGDGGTEAGVISPVWEWGSEGELGSARGYFSGYDGCGA